MKLFTRQQYLDKECTHKQYWDQFVTDQIKQSVLRAISIKTLLASTDPYMNDIKLRIWDSIPTYGVNNKMKDCGDYLTQAGSVCIMKAAARQIIEEHKTA